MSRPVSANLPEWAVQTYDALGHRAGLAVLAVLVAREDAVPHREVAAAAGLNAQAASVALRRLEDAGLVTGSIPRPQRPGPGVRWSVDRVALAALVRELDAGLGTRVARGLDSPGEGH